MRGGVNGALSIMFYERGGSHPSLPSLVGRVGVKPTAEVFSYYLYLHPSLIKHYGLGLGRR